MNFAEDQLARWAAPPSQSERDRMDNAERAVRNAIAANTQLNARGIRVFAQGSYRNRVNVRADSDVDVAVVCSDSFFWDGPAGVTLQSLGYSEATYLYSDFRREVGEALVSYFGTGTVTSGDKAFDIKANTYRVDADVAPFFEHRRFDAAGGFLTGVEMRPGSGGRIINWPDQHYDNGVAKNDLTRRAYKGCVRILKTLRYAMIADGVQSAKDSASFLMECLVFNVANNQFGNSTWTADLKSCLANLYNDTRTYDTCCEWGEVSELKYLFRGLQSWTWDGAHRFLSDCWNYAGYDG
jgi:hypothetical protein